MCYALGSYLHKAQVFNPALIAMADLKTTIASEVRRLACRVLSNQPFANNWVGRAVRRTPGGKFLGRGIDAATDALAGIACPSTPPESRPGDSLGRQFSGGQCNFNYHISGVVRLSTPEGTTETESFDTDDGNSAGFAGPILRYRVENGKTWLTTVTDTRDRLTYKTEVGFKIEAVLEYRVTPANPDQADNCGDSGPENPQYTGPVTYENEDGDTITEDTTIIIQPPETVGDGLNLTVPFFWVSPTVNVNADVNLSFDPEVNLPEGCKDDVPTVDIPDLPSAEDDPPEPQTEERLAGVVVVSTREAPFEVTTTFGSGEFPKVRLPRIGSLVFAVETGGTVAWTAPVNVQLRRQWIPVPGELLAYDAKLFSVSGWSGQIYKVLVDVPKIS